MQFLTTQRYKNVEIIFGAREVVLGMYEPVAATRSASLHATNAGTEIKFDRRWLMSLNDATRQARTAAENWVDGQPNGPSIRKATP